MNSRRPAIRHIFISPEHNFFGHHNQEPGQWPAQSCLEVECKKGSGLVGDRYFNHKPDYKGQITFFEWETFVRIREEFAVPHLVSSDFRRNVITSGLDLNGLIGIEFELQGVRFLGTEEARPCHWMNRVIAEGAKEALEGSGGLRAKILSDGRLRVDASDVS